MCLVSTVIYQPHVYGTDSETSSSKEANEQSFTARDDSMAEGSSMECSPTHNNDGGNGKQSDMDTRELEEEDGQLEMHHPAMPPPLMPPRRHFRQHIRFRE